jgi:hypothetical protein
MALLTFFIQFRRFQRVYSFSMFVMITVLMFLNGSDHYSDDLIWVMSLKLLKRKSQRLIPKSVFSRSLVYRRLQYSAFLLFLVDIFFLYKRYNSLNKVRIFLTYMVEVQIPNYLYFWEST